MNNIKKIINNYLEHCRPQTLTLAFCSVSSCLLIFEQRLTSFQWLLFLLILVTTFALQIIANFANDLADYDSGLDQERVGPERALALGKVSKSTIKKYLTSTIIFSLLSGLILVLLSSFWILVIGLLAIFFALSYSFSKFSLNKSGLAEIICLLFFGPVATVGTYYILTNDVILEALFVGLLPGLYAFSLLTLNNLRDIDVDQKFGRKNLVQFLGENYSLWLLFLVLIAANYLQLVFISQWFLQLLSMLVFVIGGQTVVEDINNHPVFFKVIGIMAMTCAFLSIINAILFI